MLSTIKLCTAYRAVKNLIIASRFTAGCGGRVFNYGSTGLAIGKLCSANVAVVIIVAISALACYASTILTGVRGRLLCVCSLCYAASVIANVILGICVNVILGINFLCVGMRGIILTCISLNALFGAGRLCCYSALIIVIKRINRFLCNKSLAAHRAELTLCKTCFCTSRIYCGNSLLGVRKFCNSLGVAILTRAGKGFYALFCACRCLCDLLGILVSMITVAGSFCGLIGDLTSNKRDRKSTN